VLQRVALCCSEIRVPMECPARCDSVCCSVLQCVAVKFEFQWSVPPGVIQCVAACCSGIQVSVECPARCVAVCCTCDLVCCSVLQFFEVCFCFSVLLRLSPLLTNQEIYRALLWIYTALLQTYRALSSIYRALLQTHRAL